MRPLHLLGGLALATAMAPLHAAEPVVLETHVLANTANPKLANAQTRRQMPTIEFAARARQRADGRLDYDCVERRPGVAAPAGKPADREEQ